MSEQDCGACCCWQCAYVLESLLVGQSQLEGCGRILILRVTHIAWVSIPAAEQPHQD